MPDGETAWQAFQAGDFPLVMTEVYDTLADRHQLLADVRGHLEQTLITDVKGSRFETASALINHIEGDRRMDHAAG